MKYRRLDSAHDYCFGRSHSDYLVDVVESPDAVAQAIKTRLLLFLGEWWANIKDGLPLWQQVLGRRIRKEAVDQLLIRRIRNWKMPDGRTPVTSVISVSSTLNSETREYSFACTVNTVYGKLIVTNADQGGSR